MTATAIDAKFAYSYMPNQLKENFTDDDYIDTIRFIASQWNNPVYRTNKYSLATEEIGLPLGFAERSLIWRDYYFGEQNNITYSGTLLGETGNRKMLKMFRGKDIMKYINYTLEPLIEMANRIPKIVSATTISENVVSKRRFEQDFSKFLTDQAEMAQYMNEAFGAYFQTPNGENFIKSAKQQALSTDFRESMAEAATNVAKDIYFRNILNEILVETGKDATVTGVAGIKCSIVNGYPLIEWIPSYEAIFPPTNAGDQHRQDAYGGRLRFMTVPEIAARYGSKLGEEKMQKIRDIAYNQTAVPDGLGWNYYNFTIGAPNFMWYSNVDGVPRVAVVEGQWASWTQKDADNGRQTKRETVFIGNKYLVDNQISTNQTLDWRSPSATDLDYLFCQPMSVFGRNMGIPEILYNYQNRIDNLQTKLDEWINQTKGTFYLIRGAYLSPTTNAQQIMADISDMRVAVVKGVDEDAGEIKNLMEQGAIEMPRDTINVINQIAMYRQMMADILNIPDAARGQIEGYQGQKTLGMQLSQSSKGTRYFYAPMFTFYNRVVQKAVDMFKTSTLDNKNIEYTLIIGDTQVKQFKATKEFGLSQQSIYLGFEDIADDGYKQRQLDMMFAFAQNPATGYTMADWTAIEAMYTKSEIKNYLQYRDFEIKQAQMAQEAAAIEAQQAQTAESNATQENITAMNNEGANARTAATLESKEDIEMAKILSKEQGGE